MNLLSPSRCLVALLFIAAVVLAVRVHLAYSARHHATDGIAVAHRQARGEASVSHSGEHLSQPSSAVHSARTTPSVQPTRSWMSGETLPTQSNPALGSHWVEALRFRVEALRSHVETRLAAGSPEICSITRLFEERGIPRELVYEQIRHAYEWATEVDRFRKFAHRAGQIVPESQPRQREELQGGWLRKAEWLQQLAIEQLNRQTGISDPEFYRQIFSIPIAEPAFHLDIR